MRSSVEEYMKAAETLIYFCESFDKKHCVFCPFWDICRLAQIDDGIFGELLGLMYEKLEAVK